MNGLVGGLVFVLIAVAVLGIAAVVGSGRGGQIQPPEADGYRPNTIEELNPETVHGTKFDLQFRGYSIEQVDAFLDLVEAKLQSERNNVDASENATIPAEIKPEGEVVLASNNPTDSIADAAVTQFENSAASDVSSREFPMPNPHD